MNDTDKLDELALGLERQINCMGSGESMDYLVSKMSNLHRTLQQSFCGSFILNYVRTMSLNYEKGYYDARNETACRLCNLMWNSLKEKVDWMANYDDSQPIRLGLI